MSDCSKYRPTCVQLRGLMRRSLIQLVKACNLKIDQVGLSLDCIQHLAKASSGELLMHEKSTESVQDRPLHVLPNAFQALKKTSALGDMRHT